MTGISHNWITLFHDLGVLSNNWDREEIALNQSLRLTLEDKMEFQKNTL